MFGVNFSEFLYILYLSFISLTRVLIACLISVILAVVISYIATSNRRNERLLIGILDILQSIPVLSFVPGVMLLFSKLGKIGIELSSILLIVTGTIWNIIFSYYSSLKSIPTSIRELSKVLYLGSLRKFFIVDFPYSIPQLTWNIILSFGGGWYFITYCEIFAIGELEYSVQGIGSYIMQKSASGENLYVILGILAIIITIVFSFFLLWFPLLRFSERFRFEETTHESVSNLPLIGENKITEIFERLNKKLLEISQKIENYASNKLFSLIPNTIFLISIGAILFIISYIIYEIRELSLDELRDSFFSLFPSILRVSLGVAISAIIAIPLGIALGLNKAHYAKIQSAIQIFSSLPAPAFVPLIYPILMESNIGKLVAPLLVIFLSSFWYLFYNTVAGVFSISSDAFEVSKALRMSLYDKLKNIVLPGASKDIFIGFLTAWGGAWNGSFVAEYLHIGEKEYYTYGIGSQISKSASEGDVPQLLFSTLLMSSFVFITNIFVWQRLIKKSAKRIK